MANFICPDCSLVAATDSGLKRHRTVIHGEMKEKACTRCSEVKPIKKFYFIRPGVRQSVCISCKLELTREWEAKCPNFLDQRRIRNHRSMIRKHFGMSVEEHDRHLAYFLRIQDGKCAICGNEITSGLDHDHRTGIPRGALCQYCNLGLGHFKDSPELLRKAVEYLGNVHAVEETVH